MRQTVAAIHILLLAVFHLSAQANEDWSHLSVRDSTIASNLNIHPLGLMISDSTFVNDDDTLDYIATESMSQTIHVCDGKTLKEIPFNDGGPFWKYSCPDYQLEQVVCDNRGMELLVWEEWSVVGIYRIEFKIYTFRADSMRLIFERSNSYTDWGDMNTRHDFAEFVEFSSNENSTCLDQIAIYPAKRKDNSYPFMGKKKSNKPIARFRYDNIAQEFVEVGL